MSKTPGSTPALLVIAGTRPELLKLMPVLTAIRAEPSLRATLCFSGQHVELIDSVLSELAVTPDHDLRAPTEQRSLSSGLAWLLVRLEELVEREAPAGVIVQGDTNTALAGALVAFHAKVPVFHVEAGLRTSTPERPFPEEMNRRLIARIAALHFAPTERARQNLLAEGVEASRIHVTGNTIVDAVSTLAAASPEAVAAEVGVSAGARVLLVTLHRRENAAAVADVARAVRHVIDERLDVEVVWILHLNATREEVIQQMRGVARVRLVEPMPYGRFVALMRRARVILTDSGGVQEEAPAFGTPVLVLREETERPEAVEAGAARVVGASYAAVADACAELLDDSAAHARMSGPSSPFGDGHAGARIAAILTRFYSSR